MPALSLQNATSRRGSGWGSGSGGIAIGTPDYFPFWIAGGLAPTSQLKNVAGDLLFTRSGAVTPTFTVQAQTTLRHAKIVFENLADAKTSSIEFDPTAGSGRLTLSSYSLFLAGMASAQLSATGLSLHLGATGFVFQGNDISLSRGDGNDLQIAMDNGISGKKASIILGNSADARASLIEFNPTTDKLTLGASAIDIIAAPGIATLAGSIVNIVETAGGGNIGMTMNLLTLTSSDVHIVRNDGANQVVTIENQNAAHTATLILKTGANQASLEFAGNLSMTTVNSFFAHADLGFVMTGYPLTLTCNGGGAQPAYYVHPAGHYWYGNFGTEAMFLTPAGELIIHGGAADYIANCRLTIKGTIANNFAQMYSTLAASVSSSRVSSDNTARDVRLMTWGSGLGGFVIGGVSTVKAGALTTLDLDNLVVYTNNSGATYSPISFGQSAAGAGDRVLLTFDALGNIVFNATYPIYIGDVGTNGTHRFVVAGGEVNIEKRVAGVYVPDVGSYMGFSGGSVYTMTDSYALLAFGVTSPSITLDRPGTYLITAYAQIAPNGTATWAGAFTAEFGIYRANNLPQFLTFQSYGYGGGGAFTGAPFLYGMIAPSIVYTTTVVTDVIEIWGRVSSLPAGGTMEAVSAVIIAIRLR